MKDRNSRYISRRLPCPSGAKGTRSWNWQKAVCYVFSHDIWITGFSKKDHSWLISRLEGDLLKPLGTMALGVTADHRRLVWPRLKRSIISENKQYVFVDPIISCSVKHRGYYKSGLMRLPVLEAIYL